MNIVIAPQAFKGSMTGMEAACAIAEGVSKANPDAQTVLIPMADGGDGTLEVLVNAPSQGSLETKGRYFETTVTGPMGEPVLATWGATGIHHMAVIEMAKASGLAIVPQDRRDPKKATTYGTGQLVQAALDFGYREIIVGLGGSATNDGGVGMAHALGARFLDKRGAQLPPYITSLSSLETIDLSNIDPRLVDTRLRGAIDVLNPLCGPQGASMVYGPQKGATPDILDELDAALKNYAEVIQRQLEINVLEMPGAGAAGGAGAGLVALMGGTLVPGADLICDAIGLPHYLADADLIFTGEGQMDGQTIYNKAPFVVARRARDWGVPVIAIAGTLGPGYESVLEYGIDTVEVAATSEMNLDEAMDNAQDLVRNAAERAMKAHLQLRNFELGNRKRKSQT